MPATVPGFLACWLDSKGDLEGRAFLAALAVAALVFFFPDRGAIARVPASPLSPLLPLTPPSTDARAFAAGTSPP